MSDTQGWPFGHGGHGSDEKTGWHDAKVDSSESIS